MIGADVDISDVQAGLRKLEGFDRGQELKAALRELRKPMRADQRDHAKNQEASNGKWPPRAASTMAAIAGRRRAVRRARKAGIKLKRRSIPRRILGRLPGAIDVKIEGKTLVARSRATWSGVHQDGGRVGHRARIPAREFLWISDSLLEGAADAIGARLERTFGP